MLKQGTKPVHSAFVVFIAVGITLALWWYTSFRSHLFSLAVPTATILGFAVAISYAYRGFGGVSGDLAGFALTISELFGLFIFALV